MMENRRKIGIQPNKLNISRTRAKSTNIKTVYRKTVDSQSVRCDVLRTIDRPQGDEQFNFVPEMMLDSLSS